MKSTNKILTLAIFGLLTLIYSCKGGEKIELIFKPEAGANYYAEQVISQEIKQKMMGQEMNMTQEIVFGFDLAADKTDPYLIDITYKKIVFKMSAMGNTISFDSDNSAADTSEVGKLYSSIFSSFLNKTLKLKLDNTGKVLEVKGIEEMMESLLASLPDSSENSIATKEQIKEQAKELANVNQFDQFFNFLPGKPVSAEESWTLDKDLNAAGMDAKVSAKLTLIDFTEQLANVAYDGTIKGEGSLKSGPPGSGFSMDGTQKGTMSLNRNTGMVEKSDMEMAITATMKASGLSIPMTTKGKLTTTIVKK